MVAKRHTKKLTKHCPTCEGRNMGSVHEGCTIEHGHVAPCKWTVVDLSVKPQRPSMVPWPASQMGQGSVPAGAQASSSLIRELYQRKVVILWEIIPNSDRFQQVMLTEEGAGRVETILQLQMLRPPGTPPEAFIVVTNPAFSVKLENVPDAYTLEQIIEVMRRGPDYTKP